MMPSHTDNRIAPAASFMPECRAAHHPAPFVPHGAGSSRSGRIRRGLYCCPNPPAAGGPCDRGTREQGGGPSAWWAAPLRPQARRQRGQTAIIALLVLLLLSFVGGLFVTIVANNLRTQGRSHRTLSADYYAEAGLRYAADRLLNSPDGADWRPALQAQLDAADVPTDARGLARYNAIKSTLTDLTNSADPDKLYLQQGFASYNTENGRFLLRVTYDPNSSVTGMTRYLKIESIGREGVVDMNDPTTFTNQPPIRLAATLVAYVPIGITDYARFETNKDNRSDVMNIGVPSQYTPVTTGATSNAAFGIVTPGVADFSTSSSGGTASVSLMPCPIRTTYGDPTTGVGGSLRANGSVRFYGINEFYSGLTNGDGIQVAGNILLNDYDPKASLGNMTPDNGNPTQTGAPTPTGQTAALLLNPPADGSAPASDADNPPGSTPYVAPSNGVDTSGTPDFNTHQGLVRDAGAGAESNDANGYPRSIARLEPPIIDTVNSATSLSRYQNVTENSPERLVPTINGNAEADALPTPVDPTAGQDGQGRSIYVNNTSDVQPESTSLVGGHTLVDEWLQRNGGGQSATNAKSGWNGPFYNPPGVDVTFGLQQETLTNNKTYSFYGIRLTRSDVDTNGNPMLWKNPDGTQGTSPTMIVSYYDLDASNDPSANPSGLSGTALAAYQANPNNDVVIYCEGNVRIKPSLLSAPANETVAAGEPQRLYGINSTPTTADDTLPRHITIVTDGTAYIEGSIIKGNADSSLTVLARDYVCLNTTQFYGGALADQNPQSTQPPAASAADGTLLDFGAQDDVLVQDLNFNTATPANAYGPTPGPYALYVSGGPSASGETQAQFDFINPATSLEIPTTGQTGYNPFDNPVLQPIFNTVGSAGNGASSLTHISFDLTGNADFNALGNAPFAPMQLWTRLDPQTSVASGVTVANQDYVQERSAILPMDIEIQAVLYAQDKSFFVIPGPWFNSDSSDNLQNYAHGYTDSNGFAVAPDMRNNQGASVISSNVARFPFYGQPVDLRITVNGAVSENLPADISAQAAWMAKWGWIPHYHGSEAGTSFELSGHLVRDASGNPVTGANGKPVEEPSIGLDLVYDPQAGDPYNSNTGSNYYLRTDLYGRPLPFVPKLPVSTGLIYAGQDDPQALLQ